MQQAVVYGSGTRPVLRFGGGFQAGMADGWAAMAGARLLAPRPIDDADDVLDDHPNFDAVLVEVERDHGPALDRLLDRLNTAARQRRHGSVVCVPPALIDLAAARAPHPDVVLLCQPDDAERSTALGTALACADPVDPCCHEGKEQPLRLRQLSEEVGRIARTLASMSDSGAGPAAPDDNGVPQTAGRAADVPVTGAAVRLMLRARRLRAQFFDGDLFADPAWDMLLDLMAARLERRQVAVSSLCIAAAVPATTALRWIKALTACGLFVRVADPRDGRRVFIELSAAAADNLSAYFQALGKLGAEAA